MYIVTVGTNQFFSMNKPKYQPQSGPFVLQVIRNFIDKMRQSPDIYPIRYYKKNRRFRKDLNGQAVK